MLINIQINSKNKNSLNFFLKFFIQTCSKKNLKIDLFLKYFPRQTTKNVFTILRSPHVNKTAQEQLEYNIFSKQINIQAFQILTFLVILKKIQIYLFSDIQIKVKYTFQKKNSNKIRMQNLNPKNYRTHFFFKKAMSQTKLYLQLSDIFGMQFLY
jgi:ribosomal protein S10